MTRPPLNAQDRAARWAVWSGCGLFCAAFWACVWLTAVWVAAWFTTVQPLATAMLRSW